MEKEFSRVHSASDITISVIILAAGCLLVALPVSTPVNILGFFLLITGLVLALILRTGYKDEPGERFSKTEKFFPAHCRDSVCKALPSSPDSIDFSEENKGNGLRVDAFFNARTGNAYVRVYEYVPYTYQPCTEVMKIDPDKAKKLLSK